MLVRVVFAIVLLLSPISALAQTEKRIALLIGNRAYEPSVGVLKNPHNDITVVGEALTKQGFEVLLPIKDARRSTILGGVRELVRKLNAAGTGAIGFLYYSGHGAAEKDTNINYLIPVDARDPGSASFWDDSVKLDEVLRLLDGARAALKFVVFDACRNELQFPSRDVSKGLVPVAEQQGFFVAYSTAPGRTATDRGDRSGLYAAALAGEFGRQGLDHLNLFQNVKEAVIAATEGAQHPWESNGLPRRVYLTGEPTLPADVALWESVRTSNDPAALQRYLGSFPQGLFAATARQMIDRLSREAAERQQAEAERKAQEEKHAAELQRALGEARAARVALANAEKRRDEAARREEDLRMAQATLKGAESKGTAETNADRVGSVALAERADAAAEEARTTRAALAAAEAKQREAEAKLAALEKREAIESEAVRVGQEEWRKVKEFRIFQYLSISTQCKVFTPPSIDIVKKPNYGAVVLKVGQTMAVAIARKDRQHCIGTRGQGRIGHYVINDKDLDRVDTDAVSVRVRFPNGNVQLDDYEINLAERIATRTHVIFGQSGEADAGREVQGTRPSLHSSSASGRTTSGGHVTCGRNGCQQVPPGCHAVRGAGGGGLGGKIYCP